MSRRTSRGNRRMFVWARSSGTVTAQGDAQTNGVDLLESVRNRYGGVEFRGATVVAVKGYLKPDLQGIEGGALGRAAMRVGPEGELEVPVPDNGRLGPGAPGLALQYEGSPEYDWMGWFPYALVEGDTALPASWNRAASPWAVDLQSARRMEELGQTLMLWHTANQAGVTVLYDLSIGIKLS